MKLYEVACEFSLLSYGAEILTQALTGTQSDTHWSTLSHHWPIIAYHWLSLAPLVMELRKRVETGSQYSPLEVRWAAPIIPTHVVHILSLFRRPS